MKKLSDFLLYGLVLMALGFSACDDDDPSPKNDTRIEESDFQSKSSNSIIDDIDALQLKDNAFNLTSPDLLPKSGSPLLAAGGVFTGKASDNFFQQVDYAGAFGSEDWTTGWAEWDPVNASYPDPSGLTALPDTIDQDTTLSENAIIDKFTYVTKGATLTINPGTFLFGKNKGSLIVTRGSKLMAEGTETDPIVFTSAQGNGSRARGDWGGVVLLGFAQENRPGDPVVEGGVAANFGGGGDPGDSLDNADNSGSLKYVRIEFCGTEISPDNEINGLTMGGVGSGTSLDYIQVSYGTDDSFEWFGGTADAKHLIAFRGADDDLDVDAGWQGKVQFALALRDPAVADGSGSNGFETDNFKTNPTATPVANGTFSNVSIFVNRNDPNFDSRLTGAGMHIRRGSKLNLYNSVLAGHNDGILFGGDVTTNAFTNGEIEIVNTHLVAQPNPVATAN